MTLAKETAVALNYTFTVIGMTIMFCNTLYAIRHAWTKRTPFNYFLIACGTTWTCAFIPLYFSAKLTVDLTDVAPTLSNMNLFQRLNVILRSYNMIWGLASLQYILLEQTRFQVIKGIMPYKRIYDHVFAGVTVFVWLITIFVFGVVWPINSVISGIAVGAFAIYGLIVDNVCSFTFVYQLYKNRQKLHKGTSNPTFTLVVRALVVLCTVSWSALMVFMTAQFAYSKDNIMRTLLCRITYSFATLQFSAALTFMYSIKVLLAQPANNRLSTGSTAGKKSTVSKGSKENLTRDRMGSRDKLAGSKDTLQTGKESVATQKFAEMKDDDVSVV
ncbi:hypothetical protein HDV00_008033 [Rhizophlyctis rosea]|nr:hypothetical protein HDV00_008033 [Rhizophlyctis rosea]